MESIKVVGSVCGLPLTLEGTLGRVGHGACFPERGGEGKERNMGVGVTADQSRCAQK